MVNAKIMAAHYDFIPKPGRNSSEEPELIPRIVSKGTINFNRLIRFVADSTTFQKGELEGAMNALVDHMLFHLKDGYVVELDRIGFFSLKLKADRPVTNKKEIHAQSIRVVNINFRAAASLKNELRHIHLQRSPKGFATSVNSTPEVRRKALENYFTKHPFIKRADYTRITGLQKNKALDELNDWVKEGYLIKDGQGSHVIFMKTPSPETEK